MNVDQISNRLFSPSQPGAPVLVVPSADLLSLLNQLRTAALKIAENGATAARPTDPILYEIYFDTTLNAYVFCTALRVGATPATWTLLVPVVSGFVTSVGGTLPIVSSGGLTPVISVNTFGASGPGHAAGVVPDPGATVSLSRYVREDSTFAPADTSIFQDFADATNTLAAATDLYTHTLPANQLNTNGDVVRCVFGGITAATAGTKKWNVQFAGNNLLNTGALAIANAHNWEIDVTLIRVSSAVIRSIVRFTSQDQTTTTTTIMQVSYTNLGGLTLSNTNILKLVGTGGATADITAKLSVYQYIPSA